MEDSPMDIPETRYAKTRDGVHIAYQVFGEGPFDIVAVNSAFVSGVELLWEFEFTADRYRWWAERGRVVLFDRRGAGLSDPVTEGRLPSLEARMEDIHTVMDEVGVERAVLEAVEDGAAQAFLFAATYPERTQAIVASSATSRGLWAPDAPWQWTEAQWAELDAAVEVRWGTLSLVEEWFGWNFPSRAGDRAQTERYGRLLRHALSPSGALAANRMQMETDVRQILPLIQAPTLVIHRTEDTVEPIEEARYIAAHIPGATLFEAAGKDHPWSPGSGRDAPIDEAVDRFLASVLGFEADADRVLATVLFTDIVGSTERVSELGDAAWVELLDRHHATVRAMLGRFRGREVDTAGDGFFATFDGPARAIRCAEAIVDAVRSLGLEVRAGLHTGEVELVGDDIRGVAVHIGARVGAKAAPSEVMVTQTVKDLVVGSGLVFEDAGEHELKGVPDRWRLYRVVD